MGYTRQTLQLVVHEGINAATDTRKAGYYRHSPQALVTGVCLYPKIVYDETRLDHLGGEQHCDQKVGPAAKVATQ